MKNKTKIAAYAWDTHYTYNVFGADEHYNVVLYRRTKKGNYKSVTTWSYSTFLMNSIAHARAERKIRKLVATYSAVPVSSLE